MTQLPHGLGRLEEAPDPRNYRMSAAVAILRKEERKPRVWHSDRTLDQLKEPACVGFSWAGWGIATPVEDDWTNAMGTDIYKAVKKIDGMPDQDGSTVRFGAKVMQQRGRLGTYFWADDVDEALDFVAAPYGGPVVFGTGWTASMFKPSLVQAIIAPRGRIVGGHAYLVIGVEPRYAIIRNSWGSRWGDGGNARIRIGDLKYLFDAGGEACAATEKPLPIGRAA